MDISDMGFLSPRFRDERGLATKPQDLEGC
jgi:hypothetical protein